MRAILPDESQLDPRQQDEPQIVWPQVSNYVCGTSTCIMQGQPKAHLLRHALGINSLDLQ